MSAVLGDQVADLLHVSRALDEGCRNEVHVVLDAEDDVALVLLGDGGQAQLDAGRCDALARGHRTAVLDGGDDVLAAHLIDNELDESVGEQELVARLDLTVEHLVVDADVRLIARRIVVREREFVALLKVYLAGGEFAEAHLRPLGVEDQRDHLPRALRSGAYLLDALHVLRMRTVGEVEACAVHPVLDECIDDAVRIRGRTLCADNFCFFQHDISPVFLSLSLHLWIFYTLFKEK